MEKRDDSLRSLGLTVIAIDKPTRADLKGLAKAEGMNLCDYLRKLAKEQREGKQAALLPAPYVPTEEEKAREVTSNLSKAVAAYIKFNGGLESKINAGKECLKLFWVAFKAVNIMALLLLIVYLFPYFVDTIVTMLNAPETSANTLKILPYIPLAVLSLSLFWCSYLMVRVIGGGFRK